MSVNPLGIDRFGRRNRCGMRIDSGQAGAIEITPEMIDAGVRVLISLPDGVVSESARSSNGHIAVLVFDTMVEACAAQSSALLPVSDLYEPYGLRASFSSFRQRQVFRSSDM